MNFHPQNLLKISRATGVGLLCLAVVAMIVISLSNTGNTNFELARREILLRRIGHELLLQSGDSTSRVLPVREVSTNEYQLSFEKPFSFRPESLVQTTQQILSKGQLTGDYIVNVVNASNGSVAYGYAISKNRKNDVISCLGRRQPADKYLVNIRFKPAGLLSTRNGYLLGGLTVIAFVGIAVFRRKKPKTVLATTEQENADNIALGSMFFDAANRKLITTEVIIELTRTEARVLSIFALSPNEIIERSRLQKEIWEDEGVIVGRSLDMFISKLRKKLEADPNVKIVVIRGKGYRLQVGA